MKEGGAVRSVMVPRVALAQSTDVPNRAFRDGGRMLSLGFIAYSPLLSTL